MEFNKQEKSFLELLKKFMEAEKRPNSVFLSGGFIRDRLCNRSHHDLDFVVTEKLFRPLTDYLRRLSLKDKRLKLAKTDPYKSYSQPYAKAYGFEMMTVFFEKNRIEFRPFKKDLKEDLKTRDFTINALYYDVSDDKVIDLVNGLEDLIEMKLKTVNSYEETFKEDASRYLRACRFMTELKFSLSDELEKRISQEDFAAISVLAKSGVSKEFVSILTSQKTEEILRLAKELGVINILISDAKDWSKNNMLFSTFFRLNKKLNELFDDDFEAFLVKIGCKKTVNTKISLKQVAMLYSVFFNGISKSPLGFLIDYDFLVKLNHKDERKHVEVFLKSCFSKKTETNDEFFDLRSSPCLIGIVRQLDITSDEQETGVLRQLIKTRIESNKKLYKYKDKPRRKFKEKKHYKRNHEERGYRNKRGRDKHYF